MQNQVLFFSYCLKCWFYPLFISCLRLLSLGDLVGLANPVPKPACGFAGSASSGFPVLYFLDYFFLFKFTLSLLKFCVKAEGVIGRPIEHKFREAS